MRTLEEADTWAEDSRLETTGDHVAGGPQGSFEEDSNLRSGSEEKVTTCIDIYITDLAMEIVTGSVRSSSHS